MNFEQLVQTFEQTHNYLQGHAVSAVNQSLTIRNWLFGQYIVEYEQNGEDRAKYGEELLRSIASRLQSRNIKGLSDRSLRNCRQFYLIYPQINQVISGLALPGSIWQMPSAKSGKDLEHKGYKGTEAEVLLSRLSFSHLIELARESDELKRAFYELQAIKGNWSVIELQRQMGSLLYERTGLSTNKEGLIIDVNKKAEPLKELQTILKYGVDYSRVILIKVSLAGYGRPSQGLHGNYHKLLEVGVLRKHIIHLVLKEALSPLNTNMVLQ